MAQLGNGVVGAGSGGLRLTRRGRIAVIGLAVCGLLGVFSLGRVATEAAVQTRPQHVVVEPGQTLWQIAERVAPSSDPRIEVDALMAVNHLRSPVVVPGEVLLLPAS